MVAVGVGVGGAGAVGSEAMRILVQCKCYTDSTMKINYILIDYENVQPADLAALDQAHFSVLVFVGASQTKVAFEVAEALQRMGPRAEYIKIAGNGSNALDFHIAFYIGLLSAREPEAFFHIISNDTGFDPLIAHLKGRKIRASRVAAIRDLPVIRAASATSPGERLEVIRDDLRRRGQARPRTLRTLGNTINALFQKSLTEAELAQIIDQLQNKGLITVADEKVTYHLAAA